jgi:hypothetical protein
MKTLKLFNAVLAKDSNVRPFMSLEGFIIEPSAMWAKDEILKYYKEEKLSGNDLNKTFHKSWEKIQSSSRFELLIEQLTHYISTYGSNFGSEAYIPNEVLEVPDVELVFKVIKGYSKEEMTKKCLNLLKSGIALTEETVDDIISVLVDTLDYTFTGNENFKNKEVIAKIADQYGIYPKDPVEFFRYVFYKTTGETLLIKNESAISAIERSSYNPTLDFKKFGLERLSEIFNRFKPLFLAYKNRAPKTINRISKLSKRYHKPMVTNPLNLATSSRLTKEDLHWLDNATPFALFKALSACYTRINNQDTFVYRIRNGKSWATESNKSFNNPVVHDNYDFIISYMKDRLNLKGKKFFIPHDVKYGLPTSEKMFVGNIPTGTKFYGEKLAVGIYWENSWGANDLDLSGLNIGGKVGWNSSYSQRGGLMFSGDIVDAPNGAVEYLYANKGLSAPTLVLNNVFRGNSVSGFKVIIGKGSDIDKKYMMDPNKLLAEMKTETVGKQTALGIMIPEVEQQSFILLNFGSGSSSVSLNANTSKLLTKGLYQQWKNPLSLNELLVELGATLTDYKEEEGITDLSLDTLEKDTLIKIFE